MRNIKIKEDIVNKVLTLHATIHVENLIKTYAAKNWTKGYLEKFINFSKYRARL